MLITSKLLREAITNYSLSKLLNEADRKLKYGCLMVSLDIKKSDWKGLQGLIDDSDLYDSEEGFGREDFPHVTILYGLHDTVPDSDIEKEVKQIKTPNIKFGKASSFSNEKYDVLKFDIDSSGLHKMNKKFSEFPNTTDYPEYHPHTTIAYLKPGLAEKYIKKINGLDKIDIKPKEYLYSKADGSKKHFKLTNQCY